MAAIAAKATGRESRRLRTAGRTSATVVMEIPPATETDRSVCATDSRQTCLLTSRHVTGITYLRPPAFGACAPARGRGRAVLRRGRAHRRHRPDHRTGGGCQGLA